MLSDFDRQFDDPLESDLPTDQEVNKMQSPPLTVQNIDKKNFNFISPMMSGRESALIDQFSETSNNDYSQILTGDLNFIKGISEVMNEIKQVRDILQDQVKIEEDKLYKKEVNKFVPLPSIAMNKSMFLKKDERDRRMNPQPSKKFINFDKNKDYKLYLDGIDQKDYENMRKSLQKDKQFYYREERKLENQIDRDFDLIQSNLANMCRQYRRKAKQNLKKKFKLSNTNNLEKEISQAQRESKDYKLKVVKSLRSLVTDIEGDNEQKKVAMFPNELVENVQGLMTKKQELEQQIQQLKNKRQNYHQERIVTRETDQIKESLMLLTKDKLQNMSQALLNVTPTADERLESPKPSYQNPRKSRSSTRKIPKLYQSKSKSPMRRNTYYKKKKQRSISPNRRTIREKYRSYLTPKQKSKLRKAKSQRELKLKRPLFENKEIFDHSNQHISLEDFDSLEALKPQTFIPTNHKKGIQSLTVTGKYFITGGCNNNIKIWSNTKQIELVKQIQLPTRSKMGRTKQQDLIIRDLYYFTRRGDEYLVSCGDDKIIRIFNISNPKELDYLAFVLKGHTKSVICLAIAPNKNYLFSGSRDKKIRVWNLKETKAQTILKKHQNTVTCLCFCKHGNILLSGSADKSICEWRITYSEKGTKIKNVRFYQRLSRAHDETVTAIVTSCENENLFISGGNDHIIKIWNLATGQAIRKLHGHSDRILNLAIIEKPMSLNYCLPKYPGNKNHGKLPHFLLISISRDKTLRIWDSSKEVNNFQIELPVKYNFVRSINKSALCVSQNQDQDPNIDSVQIIVSSDKDNKFYELEFGLHEGY